MEDGVLAQPAGALGGEAHPQLTENEYRLVAEESQRRAAMRSQRRTTRMTALRAKLDAARVNGDGALEVQLLAVISRLEVGQTPISEDERWSRAHGRKMTMRSLWNSFGTKLHDPAVVAEFDTHAWRMARLERLRRVATLHGDAGRRDALREQVAALADVESERHRELLIQLLGVSPATPSSPNLQPSPTP